MSISTPSSPDLSLVPADRLADLLGARISKSGVRIIELLGYDADPDDDIDPTQLPEDTIRDLAAYVDGRFGTVIPSRSELHVDLPSRTMQVAHHRIRLGRRRSLEHLLRDYVRFVHELRRLPAGSRFPVRTRDVHALSAASSIPFAVVRTQLWRQMELQDLRDHSWKDRWRYQLLLPTAGLAVSAGAVGAVDLSRRVFGSSADAEAVTASGSATTLLPPTDSGGRIVIPPTTVSSSNVDGEQVSVGFGDLLLDRNPLESIPAGTPAALPAEEPGLAQLTGAQALELIEYDWQTELPEWTIEFLGEQPGRLGYAFFQERRIEIYVRSQQTAYDVATVVAHELGHAVDVSKFTADDRETWLAVRGLEDHRWWPVPGASSDFASGAGDWAESFAHWLLDDTSQSELGEEPDAEELAVLADLVEG